MKKKDLAIKYSKWTTTFFWLFGVLFVFITIGGMVYSYTNLIQLSSEISYTENDTKSNFWPVFTEMTMVCLGILILVVRLNKWPKLFLFRCLFYVFAVFVLLANGYNTSIRDGFHLRSIVDLVIQEWPVICYLVFIEIALYVITNVINDRIVVPDKPHATMINKSESEKHIQLSDFDKQPEVNKTGKEINKEKFLDILKKNPDISQNKACEMLGLTQGVGTTYTRELKEENRLDRVNGKWIVSDW